MIKRMLLNRYIQKPNLLYEFNAQKKKKEMNFLNLSNTF